MALLFQESPTPENESKETTKHDGNGPLAALGLLRIQVEGPRWPGRKEKAYDISESYCGDK